MLPQGTFAGKVALVTGGGTGLGRGVSETLSHLGATVVIASRRLDVLEKTANEISEATGNPVHPVQLNVRDGEAVTAAIDDIVSAAGKTPDIVVNNAAGNFIAPTERLSSNAWFTIVDTVLNGSAYVTLDVAKRLIAEGRGGTFLYVTTTYAQTGTGFTVPSAAAKAGIENMVKSLAGEWGKYGLRFCGIAPGPIETEGAFSRLDPSGKFRNHMLDVNPSNRLGEIPELANLASFLCSPYASWVNGDIVRLDGGEACSLAGEFNALQRVTNEEWDMMEAMIRKSNKKK